MILSSPPVTRDGGNDFQVRLDLHTKTITLESNHVPMLSQLKQVADLMLEVIGSLGASK